MQLWGFFSRRLSHRTLPAAALLCVAVLSSALLAGCDRPKANNAKKAKANNANNRVVADVSDAIPIIDIIYGTPFVYYHGVDTSPDGSHYAVMHKTQYGTRLDIDGVEGMTGEAIDMPVWSHDGKSYGYRIGNRVVVNGQTFGPYEQALDPSFSPVTSSWAFLHTRKVNGKPAVYIVRDGQETIPAATPAQVNFDYAGKLIYQLYPGGQWQTPSGQPSLGPVPIPIPQWKTGVKAKSLPREKGRDWVRHQLTFNGTPIGTFDSIPNGGGRDELGTPQPDGRILIYAIDNDQLLRFYVP